MIYCSRSSRCRCVCSSTAEWIMLAEIAFVFGAQSCDLRLQSRHVCAESPPERNISVDAAPIDSCTKVVLTCELY
jgi:hypothetical protein